MMKNTDKIYGWFEVIPTMCGDSFACTEVNGITTPAICNTEQEVWEEIDDCNDMMENHDYEASPQYGFLEGDFVHYCEESGSKEVYETINWRNSL